MFLCIISKTKISKFNMWSNGLKTMHPVWYFLVTEMIIETVCLQCELFCEETEPGFQYRPWNTLLYHSSTFPTHFSHTVRVYDMVLFLHSTVHFLYDATRFSQGTVHLSYSMICFLYNTFLNDMMCFPYGFLKYLDHINFKLFHYLRLS